MTKKQSTKKGGTKGKAEGSRKKENDAQLVRVVSTAITGANDSALFETLAQLENETRVYAQHPKVVAAWLAVALEEARRMLKAKGTERLTRSGLRQTLAEVERLAAVGRSTATAETSEQTKAKGKDKAEVNHSIIAWALAGVLAAKHESKAARVILETANRLGAASGEVTTFDLRAEVMLREILDGHTSCAYDLEGQDRRKGKRAYDKLVALAGGAEGSPEPKDKNSVAWACWTMRRIRADFYAHPDTENGMARYADAWREVESLIFPLWNDRPGDKSVHDALSILAPLVLRKQFAARMAAEERGRK
jgi:hypothetical protein